MTSSPTDKCLPVDDTWCRIASWLGKTAYPCILGIGTLGNLFALTVMAQEKLRKQTFYACLMFLCVTDTVTLWASSCRIIMQEIFDIDIRSYSNIACRIIALTGVSFHAISLYVISVVAVERVLAIWYPIKARTVASRQRCVCLNLVIAGFIIPIDSFMVFGFEAFNPSEDLRNSTNLNSTLACGIISESFGEYARYWNNKLIVVNGMVPFCTIVICDALIIRKLATRNINVRNLSDSSAFPAVKSTTSKILVGVCLFYVVTVSPFFIHSFYVNNAGVPTESRTKHKLIEKALYLLMLCNHAFNCVLYLLTGNAFKGEVFRILRDRTRCLKRVQSGHQRGTVSSSYPATTNELGP